MPNVSTPEWNSVKSIPKANEETDATLNKARVIKNIKPLELIDLLNNYTSRVSGYTTGNPPVTFRYLNKKNDFVMITLEEEGKYDTAISLASYNYKGKEEAVDEIIELYTSALQKLREEQDARMAKRKEHEKRMSLELKKNKKN